MRKKTNLSMRLALFCVLFGGVSCTSDERIEQDKTNIVSEIRFTLYTPGSNVNTRALNVMSEAEICSLDLLVFKEISPGQNVFDYKMTVDPSLINSSGQLSLNIRLNTLPQSFVFLANASAEVNLLSPAEQLKEDVLETLVVRNTTKWDVSSTYKPIPMWGETEPIVVNSSGTTIPVIYLHRMLASIDLVLDRGAGGIDTSMFSLDEVYIYNRNTRGRVVPDMMNWSFTNNGEAVSSTLPPDNIAEDPLRVTRPLWHYDLSDGLTVDGIESAIYTFETKAANQGDLLKETCFVVGGRYDGADETSYYRVDIIEDDGSHIDLLRNYKYRLTITDVLSAGVSTPDEAFEGRVFLEATVESWNIALQNIHIDGSYILKLDSSVVLLDYKGDQLEFGVFTDNPGGWTFDTDNLDNGISVINQSGKLLIRDTRSDRWNISQTEERDYGWIDIQSGNLIYKLNVRKATRNLIWATSNIYYDSALSHLTFDDTDDSVKREYQGVFFRWGGLYGLSPAGSFTAASGYYLPEGGGMRTGLSFDDIPYITDSLVYNGSFSHLYSKTSTGTSPKFGDICKYLSDNGYAPGGPDRKWRMPVYNELIDSEEDYVTVGVSFSSSTDNTGKRGIAVGYNLSMCNFPFFPFSGQINADGIMTSSDIGRLSYYWSASGLGLDEGTALRLIHPDFPLSGDPQIISKFRMSRKNAYSVRCVVD